MLHLGPLGYGRIAPAPTSQKCGPVHPLHLVPCDPELERIWLAALDRMPFPRGLAKTIATFFCETPTSAVSTKIRIFFKKLPQRYYALQYPTLHNIAYLLLLKKRKSEAAFICCFGFKIK